jgi:NAD(P)-dependent dehydrogenase (short-subunit alcohol dehydrogenase family)
MTVNNPPAEDNLRGQVALVTGGGRGLGRAFAQALANAGVSVAIMARSDDQLNETGQLIKAEGGICVPYSGDVTDERRVNDIVASVEKQLGPVSLLVNNAGLMSPPQPDWQADPTAWWGAVEINLRGPFLCARAVLPGMISRGHGRIINITSPAAHNRYLGASGYVASKAALSHWTNNLAFQVATYGIVVLAYAVAFVRTAMTEYLAYSADVQMAWEDSPRTIFEEGRDTPMAEAVDQFMFLAAGKADALSGCHLSNWDDLPKLVRHAEDIQHDGLYMLRLRTLS